MATSWEHVAWVESVSEPGKRYEIRQDVSGLRGCSCLAYRFKRGEKTCKHLAALGVSEAHDEFGGGRDGLIPIDGPLKPMLRVKRLPVLPTRASVGDETFTVTRRSISFGGKLG